MTIRLTLLTPALGPAARRGRIDGGGSLDENGLRQARAMAAHLPPADLCLSAPSRRCTQTADALGVQATTEMALRELDLGSWQGRSLDELAATEPEALAAWTTDPAAAPHSGESVIDLCRRVAEWLDGLPDDTGRLLAVTDPSVARAAVLHALTAPALAFWRVDVPPLTCVQFTGRAGRWNLRMR
ncbi:histidine phosphatase family protein [Streptomyces sp. S.PNR 29]|uniref:histidine phosphatase family protein n=1 Tax=Streptomyces sp. S.PNR 29 TaxID=2973805 RepID=UPI0025B196C9|nr:histidine phosphatase family protein [Streptomyces sp. S.PNR 29]MDN0197373.1 histidine phosphatase family protein [Streptomyces sp. S.PNR 29]